MSARYSKTCSRGRAIVVETVNGSTPRILCGGSGCGGALIADAHRVTVGGAVHDPGRAGRLSLERPAQLAEDPAPGVHVDALADQRGTVAVAATFGPRRHLVDAPAQQRELQIRHVSRWVHGAEVRCTTVCS